MKKLPILMLTLLIAFSCSKEKVVQEYEIKEFVPISNNNANYLVQSFLKKVPNSSMAIASKTNTVEDKEPNESIWIIEGASNFERRTRTMLKSEVIEEFEVSLANFTDSEGNLKISEAELISKYSDIQNTILSKEATLNKSSKIVNIDIVSINNQNTNIMISAIYGTSSTSAASSWPQNPDVSQAAHALRDEINTHLAATVSAPTSMPTPASGTDWLDGDYVWYGGIVALQNGYENTLNAAAVHLFCPLCLYDSDLMNDPWSDILFDYYFQSVQDAAQIYVNDNFPSTGGNRPIISLMIEGTNAPCFACNWEFHFFENITTANAYYWIPNPSPQG